MPLPLPGPDGFLPSPEDPLHAAQLRLSDYLLAEEQRSPSGQPLPLSVAGSYVIKGLIRFCAVARGKDSDDDLKECCLWLLDAKWKQKRNTEKVMVALGEFGIGKEELIARNLIKPLPSAPSPGLLEKRQKAVVLMPANHIQMDPDGELIVVQGQLHFYRLFRSTGRMERVSDGAVLELNWPAIPDQFRLFCMANATRRSSWRCALTCSCKTPSSAITSFVKRRPAGIKREITPPDGGGRTLL